jgi:UDP-glucose 4-epimerase
LAAEVAVAEYCREQGIKFGALRYFNVVGADPESRTGDMRPEGDNIAHRLMACVDNGDETTFEIFGGDYTTHDGTAVRDYVHVTDIAAAHRCMISHLEKDTNSTCVVNVGYGHGYSVKQLIATLKDVAGERFSPRIVVGPRRPGDISSIWADNRLSKAIGWEPKLDSLEMMFQTELAWRAKR